jgi:hypothetical protein
MTDRPPDIPQDIWEDEDMGGNRDGEGLSGWVRIEDADTLKDVFPDPQTID